MNDDLGRNDEHAAILAVQRGSVPASRQFVERYQRDLLGVAFLLTGDRASACDLAERTFERAFDQIREFDPEDEIFPWLAARLASLYLAPHPDGDRGDGGWSTPLPGAAGPVLGGEPERFQVDDERSRLRNALALLDPAARLMLVLSDYAGLTPRQISVACQGRQDASEAAGIVANARARLHQSASMREGFPVAVALRELAVETPRASLWPEIESDVAALHARQRLRSRAAVLGALGIAGAVVTGLLALLLYGALVTDDDGASGAAPLATPTAVPIATVVPQPSATEAYLPLGDVPDWIVYRPFEEDRGGFRLGALDLATGAASDLPGTRLAGISPDGRTLLLIDEERGDERLNLTLIAVETGTLEERWRSDAGPLADSGPNSIYFDLTVVDDLVYVATHDPDYRDDVLTVALLRLSDGGLHHIWGLDLNVTLGAPGIEVDLLGTAEAREPALTVLVRSTHAGWVKAQQINLRDGRVPIDTPSVTGLASPSGGRHLLPGGQGVVSIPASGPVERPVVSYLLFDTMTRGRIVLPLSRLDPSAPVVVAYTLSHDGRWLYALNPYGGQLAIVDLATLQVERLIDLDGAPIPTGAPGGLSRQALSAVYGHRPLVLSPDGRHLYALGPLRTSPDGYAPGIWKIDATAWRIVDEWTIDGPLPVIALYLDGDGSGLYAFSTLIPPAGETAHSSGAAYARRAFRIDVDTGEVLDDVDVLDDRAIVGTLVDVYRGMYGRSPAVDGTSPRDVRVFTTMPAIDVQISPSGGSPRTEVAVRVALLDPSTGEAITGAPRQDVRAGAPGSVTAVFMNGPERRIAFLGRGVGGVYEGQALLDLPGDWDLTLSADDPGEDGWSLTRPAVARVVDSVTGIDGRDYVLRVETNPAAPRAGRLTELSIRFTAEGSPPAGVDVGRSLPATLDLTFPDGTVTTLYRGGAAVYSGFVQFSTPGVIFPTVTFTNFDGTPASVIVRIEVGE